MRQRYPALASRDFRIFLIGQFMSLIGTWMQSTVQPYLAYRITGQPFYLGLVGFANAIPQLLLTLPGGVLVERMNKRHVVIAMQAVMMVQAFILAGLTLAGVVEIWHIILLSVVLGAANAIEITARQAMLLDLVGDKRALPNAIGLQSTAFNVARVLGPSLSAPFLVFFQQSGEGLAFLANGLSYLFVIGGLFSIGRRTETPVIVSRRQAGGSIWDDFKQGQRYVLATPLTAALILAATVPSLLIFPLTQQVPAFAALVLNPPGAPQADVAAANSALLSAQGVGSLIAALFLASFSGLRRKGMLITVAQFVQAIGVIALGLSNAVAPSLLVIAVMGWSGVTNYATTNTVIQLTTPDELRGRVISTFLWATQGVMPFGNLLVGWLAQTIGPSATAVICGGLTLACVTAFQALTPRIRRAEV